MYNVVLIMLFIFSPLFAMKKSSQQLQAFAVSSTANKIDYDEEISFVRSIINGTLHITENKRAQFPRYNNCFLLYDRPYKDIHKVLETRLEQISKALLDDENCSECKDCCVIPNELMQDLIVLLEKKKNC